MSFLNREMKKALSFGLVAIAIVLVPWHVTASKKDATWSYDGDKGPDHWGAKCQKGQSQSPIDIRGARTKALPYLRFFYRGAPVQLVNDGHTINGPYPRGSYIRIGSERYDLYQVHFHSPSEHLVDGRQYEMEAHFMHRNGKKEIAIVGVLIDKGDRHLFFQDLWEHLPDDSGDKSTPSETYFNALNLLPKNRRYFHYTGSLTTPPCSENVQWYVITSPVELSMSQIDRFRTVYKTNSRPIQPLNKRIVWRN